MDRNNVVFKKFLALKESGNTPIEIFNIAKNDKMKNYECINLLMVLFDMSLDEARKISHSVFNNKI